MHRMINRITIVLVLSGLLATSAHAQDGGVTVRQPEGVVHGFLRLSTANGTTLGDGELIQTVAGDTLTSTLTLALRDGSTMTETVRFTQAGVFRLSDYTLVQNGPAFDHDLEAHLRQDGVTTVSARSRDDGSIEQYQDTLDLPHDIANGMPIILARNLVGHGSATVHLVAFTPKPRLIGLEISPQGSGRVMLGSDTIRTVHFVLKPKLGFLTSIAASILGKNPPDSDVWVTAGMAPAFLRFKGPLYSGPIWRLTLTSPDLR